MFVPFIIEVSTTPTQLNVTAETDIPSPTAGTFQSKLGSTIEFDVAEDDVFVGPTNMVSATGTSYAGNAGVAGTRGRKYLAGTHVELTIQKGEDLYIVQASGTSTIEGSQLGV